MPPGPRSPKAIQIGRFLLQPTSFLDDCRSRYGDYFTIRFPNRTSVISSDPAAVKTVFTGNPDELQAGRSNAILQPILGDRSVLLLDGREHLRQRRLLLPPFHGERMQAYAETMRAVAEREVASWPRGSTFAVQPSMQAITLEVILRTVFGIEGGERVERVGAPLRRLLDATASQSRLLALQLTSSENPRPRSPWGRFNALVAEADRVVYEEVEARRATLDEDGHEDVLSLLLAARDEEGQPLTDLELRDELMTLLLAGHETTATALSWTLERLVRHPEALARLYKEHRAGETEYLDATIKESLRLRPVVPAVGRYLTEPLELGDRTIPADVFLNLSIYLLHRRPDLYPDPEAFRPERFLERPAGTYEWIPFGGGTRRCLGASFALFEMRVVLQAILDAVALQPVRDAGERTGRRAITLVPNRGARIAVDPA
ncbi:MAG TPA: cytochrome P450 [Solirubrobacterales bacterium]|nr:cytochrome P450 [Solirubrobacterales bacterium]